MVAAFCRKVFIYKYGVLRGARDFSSELDTQMHSSDF